MNNLLTTHDNPDEATARQLRLAPRRIRDVILNELTHDINKLWGGNTSAILAALGTDAASLFALNEGFAQLIGAFLAEQNDADGLTRLQSLQDQIRPHTIHENGTVTLDVPPHPTE